MKTLAVIVLTLGSSGIALADQTVCESPAGDSPHYKMVIQGNLGATSLDLFSDGTKVTSFARAASMGSDLGDATENTKDFLGWSPDGYAIKYAAAGYPVGGGIYAVQFTLLTPA